MSLTPFPPERYTSLILHIDMTHLTKPLIAFPLYYVKVMRAVIQRATRASVAVNNRLQGTIEKGLVLFLGIKDSDNQKDIEWLADKVINLRIFPDENDKMNLSLADIEGEMLIVSQFTLYGDCRKGRRPGYSTAAPPKIAEPLYNRFIETVQAKGVQVATGTFQANMQVELVNDGPVTLLIDTEKTY